MFKETSEGATHSYNDGCGEKAHNQEVKDWEKQLEDIEEAYPMATYNWAPEEWKHFISKTLASQLEEVKEKIMKELEHIEKAGLSVGLSEQSVEIIARLRHFLSDISNKTQ